MGIWVLTGVVCLFGAFGGLIHAFLPDFSITMPSSNRIGNTRMFHPGVLGDVVIGAFAAGISWGLYGPLSAAPLVTVPAPSGGPGTVGGTVPQSYYSLTLGVAVGALLVGAGGAQWLSGLIDKRVLKVAAATAAASPADQQAADNILRATPAEALAIAKSIATDGALDSSAAIKQPPAPK